MRFPRFSRVKKNVALWLTCPTRHVIRWAAGKLPSITLPDGELVFNPAELAAWLERQRKGEVPSDEV
jgi:hypothetical protein